LLDLVSSAPILRDDDGEGGGADAPHLGDSLGAHWLLDINPFIAPSKYPLHLKKGMAQFVLDPAASWATCPKCGTILNMMAMDEARGVMTPHPSDYERFEANPKDVLWAGSRPGETMIDYKVRLHMTDHEKWESRSATKRRRGRIPKLEADRGYRYVLWAKPNAEDRRKNDYSVSFWRPDEHPPGPLYPGARKAGHGVSGSPFAGMDIILRKQRADARNRERVKRSRAKSRSRPFSEHNGTNQGRNGDQTVPKGVR